MNKRWLMIGVLLAAAAVFGFASGQTEDKDGYTDEVITLTGTLSLEQWHPVLKTDQGDFGLMVPPYLADEVDIQEGDTITVEGFEVPGPGRGRWVSDENSDAKFLMVTKAVINGKEYVVERDFGRGGYGDWCDDDRDHRHGRGDWDDKRSGRPRGGMMGSRGSGWSS